MDVRRIPAYLDEVEGDEGYGKTAYYLLSCAQL